jgi:hypothetical protein
MRTRCLVFMMSALLGCAPKSNATDNPGIDGSGGAGGTGGVAGALANGGAVAAGGTAGLAVGGTAGLAGGGVAGFATGGTPIQPGTGGSGQGGFNPLAGVNPSTPLDQLTGDQLVQACLEFAQYFSAEVPNADIIRGGCVQDAVFNKGATTVAQCQQVSGECIAAAAPIPPPLCAAPMSGFTCSATLSLYQLCGLDLTAQQKQLYALLVCESIEDPNIQQKLDAALAPRASCTSFTQMCPGFFPVPPTPDAGP